MSRDARGLTVAFASSETASADGACPLGATVERLNGGDQGAVVELFRQLGRGVRLLLRKRLRQPDEVEETARVILLKAAQRALDGRIREKAALTRFVLEQVRLVRGPAEGRSDEVRPMPMGIAAFGRDVPSGDREILRRYYVLGQSGAEIAGLVGMPERAVQELVRRTRARYFAERERAVSATA